MVKLMDALRERRLRRLQRKMEDGLDRIMAIMESELIIINFWSPHAYHSIVARHNAEYAEEALRIGSDALMRNLGACSDEYQARAMARIGCMKLYIW